MVVGPDKHRLLNISSLVRSNESSRRKLAEKPVNLDEVVKSSVQSRSFLEISQLKDFYLQLLVLNLWKVGNWKKKFNW